VYCKYMYMTVHVYNKYRFAARIRRRRCLRTTRCSATCNVHAAASRSQPLSSLLPSGVILSCTSLATAVFQSNNTSHQSCHRARLVGPSTYDCNGRTIGNRTRKIGSYIHTTMPLLSIDGVDLGSVQTFRK
jgi:hypothetical protein